MFMPVLFTLAKIWKQPQWPQTDEWIKSMWYVYTQHTPEYYSVIKKNKNFVICSNMDGLGGHYAK